MAANNDNIPVVRQRAVRKCTSIKIHFYDYRLTAIWHPTTYWPKSPRFDGVFHSFR